MLGTISIECSAKNPNLPLHPMCAYLNSPSSIRITNVPKRIGLWNITSVQLVAAYPDNSIKTVNCVLTGGVWVGTIEGSTSTGTSENGYTIYASGIDENGNPVSNYILGKGNIEILDTDGTITPSVTVSYVHMLSAQPDNPKEGDLYPLSGEYYIWQNGAAHAIGDDSGAIDEVKAQLLNKRDKTDLNVYTYAPWTMYSYNEEEVTPPLNFNYQKITYDNGSEIYGWMSEREYDGMWQIIAQDNYGIWFNEGGTIDEQGRFTTFGGDNLVISDDGLAFTAEGAIPVDIRRTTAELVPTSDTLAKVSQIPTIPQSYDKIQDSNSNVINANRTVSYLEQTKWHVDGGMYVNGVLSPTGTDQWVYESQYKKVLLQYTGADWECYYYQWNFDNEVWEQIARGITSDPSSANTITFEMSGDFGTQEWTFNRPAQVEDELALKSYVDGLVGDINSVLDAINGEVI